MSRQPLAVSANGYNGADAKDGQSWSGSSRNASRGGDAGPAQRGEDGGAISLTLSDTLDVAATMTVVGEFRGSGGGSRGVESSLCMTANMPDAMLKLDVRGGVGGDGGRGGTGQDGARGVDGANATRYSSGTSGGRGYDGGDGGNGSSGAPGGHGGRIDLCMRADETHLLMLVSMWVNGGAGGRAGSNGSGGRGGSGGSGGSSYSWSETKTRYVTRYDANNRSYSSTETYTEYHSNPGGSHGASGSNGRPGNAVLHAGSPGRIGAWYAHVDAGGGAVTTYTKLYKPFVRSMNIAPLTKQGVMEPGDLLLVTRVDVHNGGGMPTPSRFPVEIQFTSAPGLVESPRERLLLPSTQSVIGVNDWVVIPGPFYLSIKDVTRPVVGDAWKARETVTGSPMVPRVERGFEGLPVALTLQFPVEMTRIEALELITARQRTRVSFMLSNVSTADLGVESASGRVLRLRFRAVDTALNRDVAFEMPVRDIPLLRAKDNLRIITSLAIPADTPDRAVVHVSVDLLLQHPRTDLVRVVQTQEFRIKVTEPARWEPDAAFLFLTHKDLSEARLRDMTGAVTAMGKTVSTWDMSYHGYLDWEQVETYFMGPVVVIFGGEFNVNGHRRTMASTLVPHVLDAFHRRGIRVLLYWNTPEPELEHVTTLWLMSRGLDRPPRMWRPNEVRRFATSNQCLSEENHRFPVMRPELGCCTSDPIQSAAEKIANQTNDKQMGARFSILRAPPAEPVPAAGPGSLLLGYVHVTVSAPSAHPFVLGSGDWRAVVEAVPFDVKLRLLAMPEVQASHHLITRVHDAVAFDVLYEARALMHTTWNGDMTTDDMLSHMPYLVALAAASQGVATWHPGAAADITAQMKRFLTAAYSCTACMCCFPFAVPRARKLIEVIKAQLAPLFGAVDEPTLLAVDVQQRAEYRTFKEADVADRWEERFCDVTLDSLTLVRRYRDDYQATRWQTARANDSTRELAEQLAALQNHFLMPFDLAPDDARAQVLMETVAPPIYAPPEPVAPAVEPSAPSDFTEGGPPVPANPGYTSEPPPELSMSRAEALWAGNNDGSEPPKVAFNPDAPAGAAPDMPPPPPPPFEEAAPGAAAPVAPAYVVASLYAPEGGAGAGPSFGVAPDAPSQSADLSVLGPSVNDAPPPSIYGAHEKVDPSAPLPEGLPSVPPSEDAVATPTEPPPPFEETTSATNEAVDQHGGSVVESRPHTPPTVAVPMADARYSPQPSAPPAFDQPPLDRANAEETAAVTSSEPALPIDAPAPQPEFVTPVVHETPVAESAAQPEATILISEPRPVAPVAVVDNSTSASSQDAMSTNAAAPVPLVHDDASIPARDQMPSVTPSETTATTTTADAAAIEVLSPAADATAPAAGVAITPDVAEATPSTPAPADVPLSLEEASAEVASGESAVLSSSDAD